LIRGHVSEVKRGEGRRGEEKREERWDDVKQKGSEWVSSSSRRRSRRRRKRRRRRRRKRRRRKSTIAHVRLSATWFFMDVSFHGPPITQELDWTAENCFAHDVLMLIQGWWVMLVNLKPQAQCISQASTCLS
jgi:polynucleotide 5'-kinase involved in rRNA processing